MERGLLDHIYDTSGRIVSTGSSNAYVVTIAQPLAGYHAGMTPIRFEANFSNTGAATLNVACQNAPSGLGAIALRKLGGGAALATGDIIAGGVYTAIYDGEFFQVLELAGPFATITELGAVSDAVDAIGDAVDAISLGVTSASWTITHSADDAVAAPILTLDRISASPAANDGLGRLDFTGRDSGGGGVRYAALECLILDPADGSEDGELRFMARIADAPTVVARIGNGVQIGAPTGGYQGPGTLNMDNGIYRDGVQVVGAQGAAVANATGAGDVVAQLNTLLVRLRAHGLIAP